ncbi:MAG: hypothetical protein PUJ21_00730 [Clostridia bacterium]|nr:hypothetical protein [Clostridia bacterium]MDY6184176.1 hypothetical protein [Eubacteriales bacterium]
MKHHSAFLMILSCLLLLALSLTVCATPTDPSVREEAAYTGGDESRLPPSEPALASESASESKSESASEGVQSDEGGIRLLPDTYFYQTGETHTLNFRTYGETTITHATATGTGFSVIDCSSSTDGGTLTVEYIGGEDKPTVTLLCETADTTTYSCHLYGYTVDNGVYVSSISYDSAFEKYCAALLKSEEMDETAVRRFRESYYSSCATVESYAASSQDETGLLAKSLARGSSTYAVSSSTITVSGYIRWTDDEGNTHPCVNVRVDAMDKDVSFDDTRATCYTDTSGYYSMTIKKQLFDRCDLFIRTLPIGDCYTVVNEQGNEYSVSSYDLSNGYYPNITSGTYSINITVNMSNAAGQAFQVSQAIAYGARYARAMDGTANLDQVTVEYPSTYDHENSCYSSSTHTIHLIPTESTPILYNDWETILHEYGHHIETLYGVGETVGVKHFIDQTNMKNTYVTNKFAANEIKEKALALAWREGWATYFALSAQDYHLSELSTIPNACNDSLYQSPNCIYSLGEGSEFTVTYLLYMLRESTYCGVDYSLGDESIWNSTMASDANDIWEFIFYLYANDVGDIDYLGVLLGRCSYIPNNIVPDTCELYQDTLTIVWERCSSATLCPDSRLTFSFYDKDMTPILSKSFDQDTSQTTGYTSATFTANEWQQLVTQCGGTLHWRVGVYHNDGNYRTGPYYSPLYSHEFFVDSSTLSTEVVYNRSLFSNSGPCLWFRFTAPESGTYGFKTTGEVDTYGELFSAPVAGMTSTDNLLLSDDSSGDGENFSMFYTLSANQTVYLRIRSLTGAQGYFSVHTTCHHHTFVANGFSNHVCNCDICGAHIQEEHCFVTINFKGNVSHTCLVCGYTYGGNGPIHLSFPRSGNVAAVVTSTSFESKGDEE